MSFAALGCAATSKPEALATAPPDVVIDDRYYRLFFGFGKTSLSAEAMAVVDHATEVYFVTGRPSATIVAHTDAAEVVAYDPSLATRRAEAVKAELVRRRVPAQDIRIEAGGAGDPMLPTKPGVREPQNRYVIIDMTDYARLKRNREERGMKGTP